MTRTIKSFIFGTSFLALASASQAVLITFDDAQTNGNAIGSFYSGLGVTFTDAQWTDNFSLTGASGAQGVSSISQGFNPSATNPITATFSGTTSFVTLRGIDVGTQGFRLKAYNSSNTLIDNQVVFGTGNGVGQFFDLTVNGSIAKIEFMQDNAGTGSDGVFFENMQFGAVPEPSSMIVLALGGLALLRRRKK